MDGSIIIISILVILLWFYFMKYSEQEGKFLPVMLKQKQVISKLKDENVKMKSELKYLHNYKNDVSKTFQILDNELVMINDKIKQADTISNDQVQTSTQTQPVIPRSLFQTSFNPSILNTLLNSASTQPTPTPTPPPPPTQQTQHVQQTQPVQPVQQNVEENQDENQNESEQDGDLFNIFNRFLTGQNISNFEFSIPSDTISTETPISQRGSVRFSTNILPLNDTYRQFILNRGNLSQRNEQVEEPEPRQENNEQKQEHENSII